MTTHLDFAAVSEAQPGPRWRARWDRSWPAYEAWFAARGGDSGPALADCDAALAAYMPEWRPVWQRLSAASGGGDRAARFLSGWCPPSYLGGCSVAAKARDGAVRLVRNYDLSPDLNEGLLLHSTWSGTPVMGMAEFLCGLSDGINGRGLSVALAYGGRGTTARGFGITHILRYVLETCGTVPEALKRLRRTPSHMAYNLVLADAQGRTASVEMLPGGGVRRTRLAVATNHQHGGEPAPRAGVTRSRERHAHLARLLADGTAPENLRRQFLAPPLYQTDYEGGFGTLFTAEYDPVTGRMVLAWPGERWAQSLDDFREGTRTIRYLPDGARPALRPLAGPPAPGATPAAAGRYWAEYGQRMAAYWSGRATAAPESEPMPPRRPRR